MKVRAGIGQHQMSFNAKRALMKCGRAETIVMKVSAVVANWREYADKAGVEAGWLDKIQGNLRLG